MKGLKKFQLNKPRILATRKLKEYNTKISKDFTTINLN